MDTWVKFLLIITVPSGLVNCYQQSKPDKPDIVCQIQGPQISEDVQRQLSHCTYIIVSNAECQQGRLPRQYSGPNTITQIKSAAPHAKVMQSVPLSVDPIELRRHTGFEKLVLQITTSLHGEPWDGVVLDFDPSSLELSDQFRYAQFVKILKHRLGPSTLLSTSVSDKQLLPSPLIQTMDECMNFVILLPMADMVSRVDDHLEFIRRTYTEDSVTCMLDAGFSAEKLVLGLQTSGIMVNPSAVEFDYGRQTNSNNGLLTYNQVCELRDQQHRFCTKKDDHRCLVFHGRTKVVYDDVGTSKVRSVQCIRHHLKGIAILLDYDDHSGLCTERDFPLLGSIIDTFESQYKSPSHAAECPDGDRFEDKEDHQAYYICSKGKVQRLLCGKKSIYDAKAGICLRNYDNSAEHSNEVETIARLEASLESSAKLASWVQKIADTVLCTLGKAVDVITSAANYNNVKHLLKAEVNLDHAVDLKRTLHTLTALNGTNTMATLHKLPELVVEAATGLTNGSSPISTALGLLPSLTGINTGPLLGAESSSEETDEGILPGVLDGGVVGSGGLLSASLL